MRKPIKFKTKNGFVVFPRRKGAQPVTPELVNRLRESDVDEYLRDYRRLVRSVHEEQPGERDESH